MLGLRSCFFFDATERSRASGAFLPSLEEARPEKKVFDMEGFQNRHKDERDNG